MSAPRMPFALRVWLLATRVLPFLITRVSRQLHNRMGAAPGRFSERLGQPSQSVDGPVIWFHAASLGEVSQIGPLVRQLRQTGRTILVTTTTQAGADWVARELPGVIQQFAPMDTPGAVVGFLDAWEISAAIFIEGDFGPRLTLEARRRGIPLILLNARHSRTRERFSSVFETVLADFALITCRSEQVADGVRALGVSEDRLRVLPDLRIATAQLPCPADLLQTIKGHIGARPVWLAASTHATDEAAVFEAHQSVIASSPDALLILAPRHPKRAEPLLDAARANGLRIARRSTGDALTDDSQIYLADTLGELGLFFSLAPVTFLGGSFGEEGGHNPYEPASFGSAILSGPKVKNFADAFAALTAIAAAELVNDPAALGARVSALIGSDQAKTMGEAGQRFMQASQGSVSETVALIAEITGK